MYISGPSIYLELGESLEVVFPLVCACGHRLNMHGMVPMYDQGRWMVITSHCIQCGFDKETQNPNCKHFQEG